VNERGSLSSDVHLESVLNRMSRIARLNCRVDESARILNADV
jgi:hypothetical protein